MLIEDSHTEFKEIWKDDYLKVIAAFANTHGGQLYVGVSDTGRVKGVEKINTLLEEIPNKARNILGVVVSVKIRKIKSPNILLLTFPPVICLFH